MALRIDMVPLAQLRLAMREDNPKDHDIPLLCSTIRELGFNDPPARDETTGKLVEGHGRVFALIELASQDPDDPPENVDRCRSSRPDTTDR